MIRRGRRSALPILQSQHKYDTNGMSGGLRVKAALAIHGLSELHLQSYSGSGASLQICCCTDE